MLVWNPWRIVVVWAKRASGPRTPAAMRPLPERIRNSRRVNVLCSICLSSLLAFNDVLHALLLAFQELDAQGVARSRQRDFDLCLHCPGVGRKDDDAIR